VSRAGPSIGSTAGGSPPTQVRTSRRVALASVAVAAIVSVGIWGGVYHFAIAAANPCAGVTTPAGPNDTTSDRAVAAPPAHALAPESRTPAPSLGDPGPTARPGSVPADSPASDFVIQVVAGENFWGSLVSQIGGKWANVTSVISDPNTDPHEYQQNDSVQKAIEHAQYVILNNVGYDAWGTLDVQADQVPGQVVLNIGDSLGVSVTGDIVSGNPHLWYNPTYVNRTVAWMYDNLTSIEPALTPYFTAEYGNLTANLTSLYSEVGVIEAKFGGTVVASTESIFVYLANATGLDLISPPAFMEAVAEGNDPPDQSVVTFQCQLESGHVKVLVFNAQTVTPITTSMKTIAQAHNVSVMSVTETIVPPGDSFEVWMGGELSQLYVSLDAHQLGE
jgi:zinc/manganese transport system substrate-binding protein